MENSSLIFTDIVPLSSLDPASYVCVANPHKRASEREWIRVKAKWDTGATLCSITRDVCNRLALHPTHSIPMRCFANPIGQDYPIDSVLLKLVQGQYSILAIAHVIDTFAADCDMIIGMNVISAGKFSITVTPPNMEIRLEISSDFPYLRKTL